MEGADPDAVSDRAINRGKEQIGTLGSGNHFLEVDLVEEVYDEHVADVFGLAVGQIAVQIHSGSRGLGYQVCDDYLREMGRAVLKYKIDLPDRQLASAPLGSPEGEAYFAAMACAANYAWANRQCLMHWTREIFQKTLAISPRALNMRLVYDVCHNIAKKELHTVEGEARRVCVHRKGATRAFPAGHPEVPACYRSVGQPVLIPGDMGTNSYVLVGTELAMQETFGSTCHGAGRVRSRTQSKKMTDGSRLLKELEQRGILVMARGKKTIAEEAPEAYKDIDRVVDVVHKAGLSRRVAKLRPLCVIKG
jgi:tRNA-splicing ligase RtcB